MADILQTSLSALLSSQRALATTGHNIANVNTPGYSRQRVEFGTRVADFSGIGAIGNGVQITNVTRSYDAFLAGATRNGMSSFNRLDIFSSLSSNVDSLLSNDSAGLSPSLQSFFNAAQDLANDPSSIPARQVFIGQAESIADRFQTISGRIEDLESEMSARLQQEVDDINGLAQSIADINDQIVGATVGANGSPNDLLDARDRLLDELAGKINVTTTNQENGAVNVQIGSGQSLVVGGVASTLAVDSDRANPGRLNVSLDTLTGRTDVSSGLSGGTLGGIMDFRSEVLDPARNEIGRIAVAFASAINAQQNSGMTLNGELGPDMFSVGDPAVFPVGSNSAGGTVSASITDVGALTGSDYSLTFSGGTYSLSRTDTGEAVALTGTGTPADPFVADGVSFVVGGTPADGDTFLVRPTYNAAASMQSLVTSAQDIAAAGPLRASTGSGNTGTGTISGGVVTDASNPQLLSNTVIEFTGPGTYSINGAGSFAYVEDQPISINGVSFQISGAPAAGDTFSIEPNTGGVGDNSNILAMANVQNTGLLDGGSTSLNDSVGQLVAGIGSVTRQAENNLTAQGVLLDQSLNQRDSVSGVNLDEEAANMLRYQQAYEAAAQMITVADSLFASLLNAVGR